MRIGSLCSGYGGLELGVQAVYGGTTAWVSDIDKGACKILAHRFPEVPNIGDMTAVDWSAIEPVDLICGGTPCQDLSHAGKRAGMTEGTRSNLWVAMREAIAVIRPHFVIWENVRGAYSAAADSQPDRPVFIRRKHGERATGSLVNGDGLLDLPHGRPSLRALGRVLGDLSDLGYDASWHGLRAADVGAPHGRFRVFVVATDATRDQGRQQHRDGGVVADTQRGGCDGWSPVAGRGSIERAAAQGAGEGALLPTPVADHSRGLPSSGTDYASLPNAVCSLLPTPAVNDMGEGKTVEAISGDYRAKMDEALQNWGQYAAAIAGWESQTRPAPPPTELGPKGNPRLSAAFSEWMMGLPAGWVTEVPGITRNEALKALGNGVVPQQAAEALRVMASWQAAA